ncbi:MAG: DUF2163 domain-containing protein [Saprospiraceae bacterium]|nr:DUF2163 domain-containing protein [Saprospiraceae bacterium]
MRAVSDAMLAKIRSGKTTFCRCYRFTLNGGAILAATDLDRPLTIGGVVYASSPGISATAIEETSGFEPSNLELDLLINNTTITIDILRSGKFARAKVQLFMVDYYDLPSSLSDDNRILWIKTGYVGNIETKNNTAKIEFRGFEQALKQNIVETGSRFCRATFGDNRCKKSTAPYTKYGTVTTHSRKDVGVSFALDSGELINGYIEITAGEFAGSRFDVANNSNTSLILLDLPAIPLTGLSIKSIAGCDKSIDTCSSKFANVINFQGEPHVPTRDSAVTGKNAKAGSATQSSSGGGK